MWCSAGDADFANELAALKSAISTYGSSLASQVAGISVGSEDLYRISPTGIQNGENPGASPDTIVSYIKQVRDAIANTPLSSVPIGHVDTWTAWVNASNKAVTEASDFVGVDAYPYFQVRFSLIPIVFMLAGFLTCPRTPWQTLSPLANPSSTARLTRPRPPLAPNLSGSPKLAGL